MKDNKDFDESKLDAAEIKLTSSSTFASKISNFWYYHKWKVIIIGFFAIVVIVGIVQIVTKEEKDNSVIVAVPVNLEQEQIEEMDKLLTSFLPSDLDGNGSKVLDIYNYAIYTEDEMNAANTAETNEDGYYITAVSQYYNTQQFEEYSNYLQTGECSVLIVSEDLYSRLRANDRILPLSEVFGSNTPRGALSDGFGVRLGDTYLYEYYPEIQVLPEGTVICLLRAYYMGASSKEENYNFSREFFKNLVTFGGGQ